MANGSAGLGGTLSGATTIAQGGNNFSLTGGNVGIGTTTPGSRLTVNGSFAAGYAAVNATNYTVLANDYYVVWTGSATGHVYPASGGGPQ